MVSFIDNLILGIALTLPLGPVTLEILRRGIKNGFFESIKCVIGAFIAELIYFTIVYLGLSKVSESFFVKTVLGFFGVVFLLYIGYDNIKDFVKKNSLEKKGLYSNSFISGFLITFLNPLNFFMWAGIIGGFFAQSVSFLVSCGVLLGIILSFLAIALISKFGRTILTKDKMKYVSLIAGLFLIFYALRLLYNLFSILFP